MLWKRATKAGGFWGLACGTASSIAMFVWVHNMPSALRFVAMSPDAQPMAEYLYRALWSWIICVVVTIVVSLLGKPMPHSELAGLVYGVTPIPDDGSKGLFQKPIFWACVVITVFFVLNLIFF